MRDVLTLYHQLYYHYLQDPVFHQNAFAIITAIVLFRSMYVMEVNIRPSLRARWGTVPYKEAETKPERIANAQRDTQIVKEMWLLVGLGLSIFLGGFGIWALDNQYCSTLRRWRHHIGLPWGILLEGHGWWHLMTGIGSYFYLVWGVWLRHCLNGRQDEYVLKWPTIFSIPEVVLLEEYGKTYGAKPPNGHANGFSNGFTNGHTRDISRKSV